MQPCSIKRSCTKRSPHINISSRSAVKVLEFFPPSNWNFHLYLAAVVILEGIPTAYLLFLSSPLFRTVTQIRIIQIKLLTIFPVGNKPYVFVWKICNDNRDWVDFNSVWNHTSDNKIGRPCSGSPICLSRFVFHDLFITICLSRFVYHEFKHEFYEFITSIIISEERRISQVPSWGFLARSDWLKNYELFIGKLLIG